MTDDFRSPYEIEDDDYTRKKPENSSLESGDNKVHSLVDNDVGSVTIGNAPKKSSKKSTGKGGFWERGLALWPSSKEHKIIGSSIAAAVLVLGTVGVFALNNVLKYQPSEETPVVKKASKTEPSKLTGIEVPKDVNQKRVIGIMIENSPDARPQSGLHEAGVVFEAIAEGGITRFHALFLEGDTNNIGPVRSVRPYYAEWSAGFDAAFAHAGGSGDGLAKLKSLRMSDLDYTIAVNAYRRVPDRFAPHNLYTSLNSLRKETKRLKHDRPSKFQGFVRKPEVQNVGKTPVKNISFNVSSELYNVRFVYDKKSNSYKRYLGGTVHKDHRSGKPITPKVVVALATKYSTRGIYSVYKTNGKGKVLIFQDGKVFKGTWKKSGAKKPLQFFDKDGQTIRLNPGQTWITALGSLGQAKY